MTKELLNSEPLMVPIPPPPGGGSWRWDGEAWQANIALVDPFQNQIVEPAPPDSNAAA